MPNIWDSIFRRRARAAAQREAFQLIGRASVKYNEGRKDFVLIHHPSRDSRDEAEMPFSQLRTGHSRDDRSIKIFSGCTVIFLIVVPLVIYIRSAVYPLWKADTYPLVLVAIGIILAVISCAVVNNNFVRMDRDWRNAIQKFFDTDTRSKMLGIKDSLLNFRRFIKWRRAMAWVLGPAWSMLWLEIFGFLFVVPRWLMGKPLHDGGTPSGVEMLAIAALLTVSFLTLIYFAVVRRFSTDHRDPTLQLCVMLAEEIRYAVSQRPRP